MGVQQMAVVMLMVVAAGCSTSDDRSPSATVPRTAVSATADTAAATKEPSTPPSTDAETTTPASSDGEPTAATTAPPATTVAAPTPESKLRQAVIDCTAAFANGNGGDAWDLVSERCRRSIDETGYRQVVAPAGIDFPELAATVAAVEVDGDQGRASYETGVQDIAYVEQPRR